MHGKFSELNADCLLLIASITKYIRGTGNLENCSNEFDIKPKLF